MSSKNSKMVIDGVDSIKFCYDCGILFVYSSKIEGLSVQDNPFVPCPECGSNNVNELAEQPVGVVVLSNKGG